MTQGHSHGAGHGGYHHGGGGAGHWPPQGGYGPGPGYAAPPPSTPGSSVFALVLGLMSLFMCGCIAGIPAIIVGHIALGTHKAQPYLPGRGLAVAGLVMGYISLALTLLGILIYLLFFAGAMML